ncbi:site-specific DNA-methyltransferase [Mammaliicoccus sciuri]|jgi:adenine-specific DNA-methyltransferase|uniref:site-specific DNA-methyltransferase n=1 Tax=Mammaliicoccus TaxID=2803850 RepID=UPI002887236A|nr:site-specific DNA-methyltransferase [Mammaliicoccus sciuri]MDT0668728.1 site-specific DNA-methyltransferase [Mammaliicoccus sciuri]
MAKIEPRIFDELKKTLSSFDKKYFVGEELNRSKITEDIRNYDEALLKKLFETEFIKQYFIKEVAGISLLQIEQLEEVILYNNYWDTSYTKYENRVGLTSKSKYIQDSQNVVLDFPFKDGILTASMTKEDNEEGYDDAFLNEIIEKDEVDRLFDKKILRNVKRYGDISSVEEKNNTISFSKEQDNLVIKGNNLLALHSIKENYIDSLDCIYIDPPYNVPSSNNSFTYNNKFNHSTWLTFMKNRLEIAKVLLRREDGVLIVAIDENEVNYLGVLLDEIFIGYEKHLITVVHNPRGVQGTNFSYCNEFLYFVFPKGKKLIENRLLSKEEISLSNLRNWGGESLRGDGKNTFFPILVRNEEIIGFGDVCDNDFHPKQTEVVDDISYIYPIDSKGIERKWRYARNSIEEIKSMLFPILKKDGSYEIMLGKNFGQYKTVWQSNLYDSSVHGKQLLNKLVPNAEFSFPKSVYAVKDAIYAVIKNRKNAKVLDFFSGSGTTAHAVQMLNKDDNGNRVFIAIEQMDYINSVLVPRLVAEDSNKKNSGFVYMELMPKNLGYLKDVIYAKTIDELKIVYQRMIRGNDTDEPADLSFRADLSKIDWSEGFEENKRLLIKLLDKNELYYNYSEIDDITIRELISEEDYDFNKVFYEGDE